MAAVLALIVAGIGLAVPTAGAASLLERIDHSSAVPWSATAGRTAARAQEEDADLTVFSRSDCPQCARARTYLATLQAERPSLRIRIVDVAHDDGGLDEFVQRAHDAGITSLAVPAFYVRGRLIVGWGGPDVTGRRIEALLDGRSGDVGDHLAAGEGCVVEADMAACDTPPVRDVIDVPWLGTVDARSVGLPLFTAVVGLLDGFNPCAMWMLLLLLSLLVHLNSRLRMLLVAGTFILISGLVYFAFMAAWLNVFLLVGLIREVQVGLGIVALIAGLFSLKDGLGLQRGLSLGIPDQIKPRLYARIGAIVRAPGLPTMLFGVSILALLANSVELLCTAGLPAVYTQVLASHGLGAWEYYAYLGLYQVFYMLDDSVMLVIAVWTLSMKRLQQREGRWLKLVSGVLLMILGAALALRPELLHW